MAPQAMQGHTEVVVTRVNKEQSEQGTMGGWICIIAKVGCPWIFLEDVAACLSNAAGWWESKTHYSGFSRYSPGRLDKKVFG